MRISIDKRDRGHRFDVNFRRVRVYLDGKLFTHAVTADEEEGLVVAYRLDAAGNRVVNPERTGHVLETLRGRVRVDVLADDGGSVRTPKVCVERNTKGSIEVLVYSRMRVGNIRRMTMDVGLTFGFSFNQLAQACGFAASAAAEHLCEKFGDMFDPSDAARAAVSACEELMAREAESTRH